MIHIWHKWKIIGSSQYSLYDMMGFWANTGTSILLECKDCGSIKTKKVRGSFTLTELQSSKEDTK